jgi:hypothetical protein
MSIRYRHHMARAPCSFLRNVSLLLELVAIWIAEGEVSLVP